MSNEDIRQLDLLAIFHYVVGGLTALFSCFPFLHVFLGMAIILSGMGEDSNGCAQPEDTFVGWIFVIMGSIFIVCGWIVSICIILAGRKLKRRRNRMYCMVVAGITCAFMPFGTILGVFTLIVLNRDSVKALFAEQQPHGT